MEDEESPVMKLPGGGSLSPIEFAKRLYHSSSWSR
jgi:hypothetical protein